MKTVAIIPARFASTRFPGKPLADETGKFLIQHVCQQVEQARSISKVIVATDDERIFDAVRGFGGNAEMTRENHTTGTDRVAEVAAGLDADLIVNVQGDEPEIQPADIDQLVQLLASDPALPIGTLACPFAADGDPTDPNAVKVVCDAAGRALYFSRGLLPYPRTSAGKPDDPGRWLLHLGIYAYRRDTLLKLCTLPPTPLEEAEKLEQLRFLENGFAIGVGLVKEAAPGIDTPEDYAAFVRRVRET